MASSRIAHALNQTGTLYSVNIQDKFGKTTYNSGTSVPCRVERVTKNIVTATNELTPIHAFAMFDNDITIQIGYKFRFDSKDYKIMTVEAGINRRGEITHYEANLQEWSL